MRQRDRLLTLELLEPLRDRGFTHLALEALWWGDPINERGYPTDETGYYVNDVVFAELVRTALALGYELIPYEIEPEQRGLEERRREGLLAGQEHH